MLSSFKDTQPQSAERLFATYESLSPIIEFGYIVDDAWARRENHVMTAALQQFGLRLNQRASQRCFITLAKVPYHTDGTEAILGALEEHTPSQLELDPMEIMTATVRKLHSITA